MTLRRVWSELIQLRFRSSWWNSICKHLSFNFKNLQAW